MRTEVPVIEVGPAPGRSPTLTASSPVERIAAAVERLVSDKNGRNPDGSPMQGATGLPFRALEAAAAVPINSEHINLQIDTWVTRLRWISRWTCANSPYAWNWIEQMTQGIIGDTGFQPEIFPDPPIRGKGSKQFQDWVKKYGLPMKLDFESAFEDMSVGALQRFDPLHERDRLLLRNLLIDGEYFLLLEGDKLAGRKREWGFRTRIIDPGRCPLGLSFGEVDTTAMTQHFPKRFNLGSGKKSVAYGRLLEETPDGELAIKAYAFRRREVLDDVDSRDEYAPHGVALNDEHYDWYHPDMVCHVFLPVNSEQARGYPMLAPAIYSMVKRERYEEAAVISASVASLMHIVVQQKQPRVGPGRPSIAEAAAKRDWQKEAAAARKRMEEQGANGNGDDGRTSPPIVNDLQIASDYNSLGLRRPKPANTQVMRLGDNEEAVMNNMRYPNSDYGDFMKSIDASIAAGCVFSREYLTMKFESNYALVQHAKAVNRERFERISAVMQAGHLRRELMTFLEYGLMAGGALEMYRAHREVLERAVRSAFWVSRGVRSIDTAKQQNAISKGRETGVLTFSDALRGGETASSRTLRKHLLMLAYEKLLGEEMGFALTPWQIQKGGMPPGKMGNKPRPSEKENNDSRPKEDRKGVEGK